MSAEPTRRIILGTAVSASLLLAGCKGLTALGPLPRPAADVATLDHAIRAEELMISRYVGAIAAVTGDPDVTKVLGGLLTEHKEHLAALRSRLVLPERLATASPAPSPQAPAPPAGPQQILAELAAAEQAASARLSGQLRDVPGALAQLMASISASEAAHVVVLGRRRPAR